MVMETYVFDIVLVFAVLFSVGSLFTKDNFYSALYMAFTLIMVASAYALANIQEVFILITFIFVGAIGIVTVSLSAVYKFKPKSQLSKKWIIPSAITLLAVSAIFLQNERLLSFETSGIELNNEYLVLLSSFIALMVLLMVSVLSISRGD